MKPQNTSEERDRESRRAQLISEVTSLSAVDNFPLFINRQQLISYLVRYELFKKILNIKGSIIECGVHQGGSLMLFSQLSAIFEPYALNRQIIGFDTFEGFPSVHHKDGDYAEENGMSDTEYDVIRNAIQLFDENRPIGHLEKVHLVKGDACETIPEYFREHSYCLVALLYLDFDLYEPTKVALQTILPRMPKGSIVAFDELHQRRWQGETIALLESFNLNDVLLEKIPEEPHISYFRV